MVIPVIIVDDDRTDRMIARRRVERSPRAALFSLIREYRSGDALLADVAGDAVWREGRPLILMDVNMPGMDGFETVDALGRLRQGKGAALGGAVVVMMSASANNPADAARVQARSAIAELVAKPLRDADLVRLAADYGTAAERV